MKSIMPQAFQRNQHFLNGLMERDLGQQLIPQSPPGCSSVINLQVFGMKKTPGIAFLSIGIVQLTEPVSVTRAHGRQAGVGMSLPSLKAAFNDMFLMPLRSPRQFALVLAAAGAIVFMLPVRPYLNDWDLNTTGLWNGLQVMYHIPDRVYPPWAYILLLPIRWMRIEGVKLFSVLVLAWLVRQRRWPFYSFFLLVLSPYFLNTMYLVNFDILAVVSPVLLWEFSSERPWEWLGRGVALSYLFLKPQTTFLLMLFMVWDNRKNLISLLLPGTFTAAVLIPISLIGTPPLFVQWINNLTHPSEANQFYWSINNISLSNLLTLPLAAGLVLLAGGALVLYFRRRGIRWTLSSKTGMFLMASMLLSPYTSRQSIAAGLSFLPSVGLLISQYAVIILISRSNRQLLRLEPLVVLLMTVLAAVFHNREVCSDGDDSRVGEGSQIS